MEPVPTNNMIAVHQQSVDCAKLIRKLRWIGMETKRIASKWQFAAYLPK